MCRNAIALLILAAPLAWADVPAVAPAPAAEEAVCTTTTTTSVTCKGAAAPLAAPPRDEPAPYPTTPAPAPTAPPPGYAAYIPPPVYYLPPMKTHVEERPRYGLIGAGLGIFGGIYIWNLTAAMIVGDWRPAVPVIGPFIIMADRHADGLQGLLLVDGLGQLAGAILTIAGAASRVKVTVYDKVAIVPTGAGVAAFGRF